MAGLVSVINREAALLVFGIFRFAGFVSVGGFSFSKHLF